MLCGDNGVTYTSMCELNKAECEIQKEITVVKKGKCPGKGKFSTHFATPTPS